jgi:PmbA protein
VRNGEVETVMKSTPGGLAIRFYSAGKMAFAHSTDLSESSLDTIIGKLSALAKKTEADPFAALPGQQKYPQNLDIYDKSRIDKSTDDKINYLVELEKLALKYDPLISKSNGVYYSEGLVTKTLGNSKGVRVNFDSTYYRVGISVVVSKNGEMYPGEGSLFTRYYNDMPSPDKIVEHFASRAVRLIGGTPVESGEYEIIFTPRTVNSILEGLNYALNGENSLKSESFLADKMGQKIAVDKFSVYDDALKPRGIASRPADDEGTASQTNALIENGILKGFLYDLKTANKIKGRSTGSASRDDYSSFPVINSSNFFIASGSDKAADVIAACKKGIIVEETAGWGLHSVTGQYSAGINGILVENGKKIRPVAGVTIAASADDILNGIGAICDDLEFFDNFSSPTIMVKKMTVGS